MADFKSAVDQILAEAMDHCVLQQVAAINCSSFSHSVLPSNLEARFQRLKTFPSSSSSSSGLKPAPKPQLAPDSANELKNLAATELKDEKPVSDDSAKTPEKERKFKGETGSGYHSSPSGSSNSSSGYSNSPNLKVKKSGKKGNDENLSSGSFSIGSKSLDSSPKRVKTGCFWCSPKRVSRKKSGGGGGGGGSRNGAFDLGDDWGKHDEILSDLRSFSTKKQDKLMKIAKKEEKMINKEAEKIVKWAKQTSAS
ncbi:hypothetical protein SOVF_022570 [Spinacia oleracea]|nr:hypothetical protein SOVF_022570 [Spinacia oleracea]